ncbi:MAG: LamG-like jellyroll fold domain-containing protein, partial [Planctomycetota bacterium]
DDPNQQIYDNKFNTIYNNHIYRAGAICGDAAGVYLWQSGDNEITHNSIHDHPRYGIGMKGHGALYDNFTAFGDVNITDENYFDFFTSNNNLIRYNDIYNCIEDSYDAGAVSLRRPGKDNVIDNNRIHDINPLDNMDYTFCFGIYLDGGTSWTDITNNVIYGVGSGTTAASYPINCKKVDNLISNNILVSEDGFAGTIMIQEGGGGEPLSLGFGNHVLTNNILYGRGTDQWLYRFHESEFDCDLVDTSENNLFHKPDGGTYTFYGITGDDTYANWKSICSSSYDQNSVTSDPLFVNESSNNYNISQASPAYSVGFTEIDQNLPGLEDSNYTIVDNLVAKQGDAEGEIHLDWDNVSGASSYKIKRSTASGQSYSTVGTPSSSTYTDTSLTSGTKYYYKVCAVISSVDQTNSKEVSAYPATLVAHWKFDETSGSTAADSSGNGHDATVTGAAWWSGGEIDGSLNFDGADYVTVPPEVFEGISSEITICLWQYGDAAVQPQNDRILWADAGDDKMLTINLPYGDGTVYWDAGNDRNGTYDRVSKAATASQYEGQWNHWAFCKNAASENMTIYLNGNYWTNGTGLPREIRDITACKIGSNITGNAFNYDGIMDDFRIYNYRLTSDDIADIYAEGGNISFSEGFEGADFSNWTTEVDWEIKDNMQYTGTYSGLANADSGALAKTFDTSSSSSITIGFWYIDDDIDDADNVYLKFKDSSSNYDNIRELGNSTEDTWHYYTWTTTAAQYMHSGFEIRFVAGSIDTGERLWIDDLTFTAD